MRAAGEGRRMLEKLMAAVRILFGIAYVIGGMNWFIKMITPYPSLSDFQNYMPPPDIVGAMIDQGVLFTAAKAIEVVVGIALLANRYVPLALVAAMPVTVTVFIVDVFKPEFRLRSFLMGSGSFTMNVTLLIAYFHAYRPMLAIAATPSADPTLAQPVDGGRTGDILGVLLKPLLPVLLVLSTLLGLAMVCWMSVMIAQYVADPKAFYEIRELVPREGLR